MGNQHLQAAREASAAAEAHCDAQPSVVAAVGELLFKALADGTRRTILDELTDRDAQTLFELCSRLITKHGIGVSRQAISQTSTCPSRTA